jgi:Tol biopolymer transport system component
MQRFLARTALFGLTLVSSASAQSFELVSVGAAGLQANQYCQDPWISANGTRTVFHSGASNLVAGDSNNADDIFLHDSASGLTTRVSVATGGAQGDGYSSAPRISADGRYVAFLSGATNLAAGDTNGFPDVFVHDTQSGVTTRVSGGSAGAPANGACYAPSISDDGRYVAFHSAATNLVVGDTNNSWDVFVHDRHSGITTRASVNSSGAQGSSHSAAPSLSGDGRFVAFHSNASNLIAGDTNGAWDIFVRDLQSGAVERVSRDSAGAAGNGNCADASISADGRYVAFHSAATNLVANDNNARDDAFVHDRTTGVTRRVSVSTAGVESSGACKSVRMSGNGRSVVFLSQADNLDGFDFNAEWDVYQHDLVLGTTAVISLPAMGGVPGDTSAAPSSSFDGLRVAFSSYRPDLVPVDLNNTADIFVRTLSTPPPSGYCTASTSSGGCVVSLASSGVPSASSSASFTLSLSQIDGQRSARVVYGLNGPMALPWASGSTSFLCVRPPLQRTPLTSTGGVAGSCSGSLGFDFKAFLASHPFALGSPLTPGDTFCVQAWIFDPSAPKKSQLSSALTFVVAP